MVTAKIEHDEPTVPHVYTALFAILKALSVPKNGTLPGNMGGKMYITAVDASAEVKRQFVENNLILLPNESVFRHEVIAHKDRLNTTIVITGEYTIVSTVDGSKVTVAGTGDGLAGGTAVASNIASTNALKNALLRTFLITEQSVEDASKQGDTAAPSATQQAINKARTPVKPTAGGGSQDKIREWIGADDARKGQANEVVTRIKAEKKLTGVAVFDAAAAELGL
jgi:hypothetical protein